MTLPSLSRSDKKRCLRILLAAFVLVIVAALAVNNPRLSGVEGQLTLWIYNWPIFLYWPMTLITQLGSAWFALLVVIFLALIHKYRLGIRLLLATGLAYLLAELLKIAVHRPRPFLSIHGIVSRESLTHSYGFPSGHTAVITTLVFTLWPYLKAPYRYLAVALLLLVPLSRLYLGVHSPLDVAGGFCVGIIAATSIQFIKRILPKIKTN